MNIFLTFLKREREIYNDVSLDFALGRLCVPKDDSWRGITPSITSSDYNPEPPIFSSKFANCNNYKHILAIANEDGKIALHDTTKRNIHYEERALEGQQCHNNAVFDLEWCPGTMKFVSASGDHTARLWQVTESEIKYCQVYTGHTRSVKTAAFRKNDSAVFATGGREGAILIWDTRAKLSLDLLPRADNCIYSGHAGGPGTPVSQRKRTRNTPKLCSTATSSSITGLVFQDDNTLVSCGGGDGIIKVWDLRRNYSSYRKEPLPKHSLMYAGVSTFKGFTNLLCNEAGTKLFANCMDNSIYCYNLTSYSQNPIQKYVGFRNSTFYIKACLSPDEKYLCSGSSDEKAYIWNLKKSQPLVTLNGHTVEVTCVAWSSVGDQPIVTCSDDARHKVWHIGSEEIPEDEKINLKGTAMYCNDYFKEKCISSQTQHLLKTRFQALDRTPRSLKRIVEENEKTPSSVEKVYTKRSYCEMMIGEEFPDFDQGSDQKRPHLETRARRLFSPSTSALSNTVLSSNIIKDEQEHKAESIQKSSTIIENIVRNLNENSNQENDVFKFHNQQSITEIKSPLSEHKNFNSILQSSSTLLNNEAAIFSPTSNLPNYVINGEAPHLGIMSPKRQLKGKVDWLTKIRKQKLMSTRSSPLNVKILSSNDTEVTTTLNDCLSSPRLQNLKESGCSNILRRNSNDSNLPKTPSRRNCETTILKFFSTISTNQQNDRSASIENSSNNSSNNIPQTINVQHNVVM